jgi:hypothetical protein
MRIVNALRARDAMEVIKAADAEAVRLGERLANAEQSDYANDMAWLADYEKWKGALGNIDTIIGYWQNSHEAFLNIGVHEVERVRDMPPANVSSDRTITQYKRLRLVNERYQSSREGIMVWFREKTTLY